VCIVWKTLAIVTTFPIVLVVLVDQVKWSGQGLDRWVDWWAPRLRFWWVGVSVWVCAVTMFRVLR
jgi:hypothetical protein